MEAHGHKGETLLPRQAMFTLISILFILGVNSTFAVERATNFQFTSPQTVVRFEPHHIKVQPGQNFTIAVTFENVSSLYGFDIQITWNPNHLKYLNHTATIPVETYPTGLLHEPLFGWRIDDVDENASMPGAEPGTRYWIAASSQYPAPVFNGSGSAFLITFETLIQTGTTMLDFTQIDLSDDQATPIPYQSFSGVVEVISTHDIAVTHVALPKTIVGKGYPMTFNVTAENQGLATENFNLTTHANATIIQTKSITLPSEDFAAITFTWNTTGFAYGNYTVRAYAWPVLGETETADNTFVDGVVTVVLAGDLNDDGIVDYRDINRVARMFGKTSGDPQWDPNSDVIEDGIIDYRDINVLCRNYGKTRP